MRHLHITRTRSLDAAVLLLVTVFPVCAQAQYTGTGSVTQGLATTTTANIYSCPLGRVPGVGTITASDATTWTVPAVVHFTDAAFPFASVLHNACTGATYATSAIALAALDGSDIVIIDPAGEVITAYVFADNYFEMYINGIAVGKDDVPYTQFNSNIVRFKVHRPFTVAMLLVDWEESLGLGTENSNGFLHHAGDGGMVAVFTDAANAIIATTGSDWKAQTFYTAPIMDLACPTESGTQRLSNACSTQDSNDGSSYHGLHWDRPVDWMEASFDDASWPLASTFTNATVGVNNKPAYTNFTNIFDDPVDDAEFIWSTNLILDNEVVVRHTVALTTSIPDSRSTGSSIRLFPNPAQNEFQFDQGSGITATDIKDINIHDAFGRKVYGASICSGKVLLTDIPSGVYSVTFSFQGGHVSRTLVIQ